MDKEKAIREYLLNLLTEYSRAELEGKRLDLYFVLRTDLDRLNNELEVKNISDTKLPS